MESLLILAGAVTLSYYAVGQSKEKWLKLVFWAVVIAGLSCVV